MQWKRTNCGEGSEADARVLVAAELSDLPAHRTEHKARSMSAPSNGLNVIVLERNQLEHQVLSDLRQCAQTGVPAGSSNR